MLKSFYSEKKGFYDISKLPDIYDSVKHDAIHNSHLGLNLTSLYTNAKRLADVVIPNEYGLDPQVGRAKSLVAQVLFWLLEVERKRVWFGSQGMSGALGHGPCVHTSVCLHHSPQLVVDSADTDFPPRALVRQRQRTHTGSTSWLYPRIICVQQQLPIPYPVIQPCVLGLLHHT